MVRKRVVLRLGTAAPLRRNPGTAAFAFFGKVPKPIPYDNTTLAAARILGDGVHQRTRVFSGLQSRYAFADRSGRSSTG